MRTRSRTARSAVAVVAAAAMALSACSDDPTSSPVAADENTDDLSAVASDSETSLTIAEEVDQEAQSEDADAELITIEADGSPVRSYLTSAMGGVKFEAPESALVLISGDHILVTDEVQLTGKAGFGLASVGLTSMLGSGAPLESAEQYLDVIRDAGVDVTPTGTKIELMGHELVGYEYSGGSADLFLFAADRVGAPVQSGFGPEGSTIEFVGDTESGVLTATASEPDGDPIAWLPTLGTLLEGLELTGPGLDPALPPGETIEVTDGGPPPDPAAASDDPASSPALGEPFSPLDPGRYELLNFGIPVSVEVPEDWFVQPNFPGVIVLTKAGSIGPGDRDIVWINDIRELAPIAGGPVRAGDPLPLDDIEAILADPPNGMAIDSVERFDLVAANGDAQPVVSFNVSVDTASPCSPADPCDYALITSYGFVKQLLSTSAQRVWFFPEHPTGPAAAVAQTQLNSDFLGEAEAVMATLELRS